MNSYQNKTLPVYLFVLSVLGLLLVPSFSDTATAQPSCFVRICKEAPELPIPVSEADAVFFPFTLQAGDISEQTELPANLAEGCRGSGIESDGLEVSEDPLPGWALDQIVCDKVPGINVTIFDNGVSLECVSEGTITCTFINVKAVNVPALSEWGMIAAAAGLALIGVFFALRRRKAFNT